MSSRLSRVLVGGVFLASVAVAGLQQMRLHDARQELAQATADVEDLLDRADDLRAESEELEEAALICGCATTQ